METYLKVGFYGVILALALNFLMLAFGIEWIPPFLPAFTSALAVITTFKMDSVKEALLVALASYFFPDALLGAFAYGLFYFMEPVQVTVEFSTLSLINLLLNPITAIIAAYLGTFFVKITRP